MPNFAVDKSKVSVPCLRELQKSVSAAADLYQRRRGKLGCCCRVQLGCDLSIQGVQAEGV